MIEETYVRELPSTCRFADKVTLLCMPCEIHCYILEKIDTPYWALFGQTCKDLQAVILYLKSSNVRRTIKNKMNAWEIFIRDNNIGLFVYLLNKYKPDPYILTYAIKHGNLDVFKFALKGIVEPPYFKLHSTAARYGQVKIIKWIEQFQSDKNFNLCKYAAIGGQLSTIIWLMNHGWSIFYRSIFKAAMENHHLSILIWVLSREKCYRPQEIGGIHRADLQTLVWWKGCDTQ